MKFKQLYIICLVILCLTGQDASSLSLSSSPLSILKIRNEIYTVKDNNAKSSGQILSLSIIFDQQIYYRHAGCGGTPKPVGSLNFGYRNRLGNIHGSIFCNGTVLSSFERLTLLPIPSNTFQTLNKYTRTIQQEKLKMLEGNVLVLLVDIPGKAKIISALDVGTCALTLNSCKFSIDMPGGSISNFAGREVIDEIIFPQSHLAFQPPMLMLDRLLYRERTSLAEMSSKLHDSPIDTRNLIGNTIRMSVESGEMFQKEENDRQWINDQVVGRSIAKLSGKSDMSKPGGIFKDPLNFVGDMLRIASETGSMIMTGIKEGLRWAKEKVDLAISKGAVAAIGFLETETIKINKTNKEIGQVQIEALKKAVQITLKQVNGTTKVLYKALKDSIKFTKALNELHELLFTYDSQANRIGRTIEKGEFWNQFALDAAQKASEKYQHIISVNERTVNALLNVIDECKSRLTRYKNAIEKVVRSVILSQYAKSNKMLFFSKTELYIRRHIKHVELLITKYAKDREQLNRNLHREEFDGSFLEAKTNEQVAAQLNLKTKSTLMELLRQGHYLHMTGQAKDRIEADQWIELGAGTSVDQFLGMQQSSQAKLDADERLTHETSNKGIPGFIAKLGLNLGPKVSMPGIGTVGKRLVKILSHSLTSELAKILTDKISMGLQGEVTHYLVDKVVTQVPTRVGVEVSDGLTTALQTSVGEMVPMLTTRLLTSTLEKTMFRGLVDILTRALTHTLSSTLTYTLSMGPDEHVHCYNCKHHGLDCNKCQHISQTSDENLLAMNYYASFYSDYYSDYYRIKSIHHEKPYHRDPEGATPVAFQSPNMEG